MGTGMCAHACPICGEPCNCDLEEFEGGLNCEHDCPEEALRGRDEAD